MQIIGCIFLASCPVFAQSQTENMAQNAADMLQQAAIQLEEADGATNRIAALTRTVRA